MRKIIIFLICILLLVGCRSNVLQEISTQGSSVLSKVNLTDEESEILDLVGIESDIEIYEYKINESYQSISIWLEAYDHGELVSTKSSMSSMIDSEKGRIAVLVDMESNYRWKISQQSDGGLSSYSFSTEGDFETNEDYSVSYSSLGDPVEIKPGQVIILKTFLYEDGDSVSIYDNQHYVEEPEVLDEYDYVYLLKCQFSKEPVGHIEINK